MTRFSHNSNLYYRFKSVLHYNTAFPFPVLLFFILVYLSSCEESPTNIGIGLLPGKDFVNIKSTDTLEVDGYTQYIDSTITNNRTYSYLGRTYDPFFGDTRTDFVGQLRILGANGKSGPWPGGGAFSVDSVRLFLSIAGAKGTLDSNILRQISLYEITEMLDAKVKYYSNRNPNAGMNVGTFNLPPIGNDTTVTFTIPLPLSFGEYLMRDTTKLTQDDPVNDFRSFFKGLYVSMLDNPEPLLVAVDFTSTNFLIRVYYKNSGSADNYFDFVISPSSVRYNRYNHNFSTADPVKKIKHINDGIKDTMIYLQAFNGVFPQLKMPDLSFFKTLMPLSVNMARLTFSVYLDDDIYKGTNIPPQILMKYTKSDTIKYLVPDYQIGKSFYDGTFNLTKKTYTFNLASFIQEYLEGNITDPVVDMYFPEGEYKNAIIKANTSLSPVKFEFTFTRF